VRRFRKAVGVSIPANSQYSEKILFVERPLRVGFFRLSAASDKIKIVLKRGTSYIEEFLIEDLVNWGIDEPLPFSFYVTRADAFTPLYVIQYIGWGEPMEELRILLLNTDNVARTVNFVEGKYWESPSPGGETYTEPGVMLE